MSFCANCGSKLLEDDVFCGSCGKKMPQSIQIEDENNNKHSTSSSNIEEDKAFHSAKTIGSSTVEGNLTYLKDFNYKSAGVISISYIDGIVAAEDKTSQTHIHGHIHGGQGRVSSTVVNKQYIHIKTANGKEINLTAFMHIHLRAGNHVRLYYACKKGIKPENISMPNFLENTDSDMFTCWTEPDFIPARPQVDLKIIAVTFISALFTCGFSIVFIAAWFYYRFKEYNKNLKHLMERVRTEINHP